MSAIALGVEELTDGPSVQSQSLNQELSRGQRFRRHFVWDPATAVRSRTVCWAKFAEPLPSPPASKFDNLEALATIQSNSHLFRVVTPINVDRFQPLLSFHSNQPFVESVCRGLPGVLALCQYTFWGMASHMGQLPVHT